jgi:hypothetical protein
MFAWIRRRFLAPHPLRLTETLARLEGLSWDDSEQHPSAIEPGGDSGSQAYACPGSSTRQSLGTLFQRESDAFHVLNLLAYSLFGEANLPSQFLAFNSARAKVLL